jgi:hypothetical protein
MGSLPAEAFIRGSQEGKEVEKKKAEDRRAEYR